MQINKFFFIITIIMFSYYFNYGQTPTWSWVKTAGGTGDDRSECVALDRNGNVYNEGYYNSPVINFGNTVLNNPSFNFVTPEYLIKFDSLGNVIWAKNSIYPYGGSYPNSLAINKDENYLYLCGQLGDSIRFGNILLNSMGSFDIWVAKFDTSGNVIWARSFGGIQDEFVDGYNNITIEQNDNIIVAGRYRSDSMYIGNNLLVNSSNVHDIFIAKYDSSGNVLWAKSCNGVSDNGVTNILSDSTGNIYIMGYYHTLINFGNYTLYNLNIWQNFIAKYDPSGNFLWARSTDANYFNIDKDYNLYFTGVIPDTSYQIGGIYLNLNGNNDIYIAKYDSSFNLLWAKGFGGNLYDICNCISIDKRCNLYLSGICCSSSFNFNNIIILTNSNNYSNAFIVKCDSSGNAIWAKKVENDGAIGNGTSINAKNNIDKSGNVIFHGDYQGYSIFDNDTILNSNIGYFDIFIAKLSNPIPNAINASSLYSNTHCAGDTVNVNFLVTGTFNSGNTFTAELSDATGSFTSPIAIGTINDTTSGTINATIPSGTTAGIGYRIRVRGSNPSIIGSDNGSNLTINAFVIPAINIVANPSISVCPGTAITFTANPVNGGTPSYQWMADGLNVGTGSTLSGTFSNGQVINCVMTSTAACVTTTNANSTNDTVVIYTVVQVTITETSGIITSSATTGNQWYEQTGGIISGETGQFFTPTANGYYYSVVTDIHGCTSTSNILHVIPTSIDDNLFDSSARIYPNPTNGQVNIDFGKNVQSCTIMVENILGIRVTESHADGKNFKIDLSKFANGIYFIYIKSDKADLKYKAILNK